VSERGPRFEPDPRVIPDEKQFALYGFQPPTRVWVGDQEFERVLDGSWPPRYESKQGYVCVFAPYHPIAHPILGTVLEHRMVVYDAGIELTPEHVVHHLNGVRSDNRLENLEVVTRHTHEHDRH